MKITRVYLIILSSLVLHGCSTFNQGDTSAITNPRKIHVSNGSTIKDLKEEVIRAMNRPVNDYYSAMKVAETLYSEGEKTCTDQAQTLVNKNRCYRTAKDDAIKNYVFEGLGLVDAYCIRWFDRLDDTQRKVDLENANFNVITQLGTAALGLLGASSNSVAGYGAATTARAGLSENYSNAFLLAPNARKIKSHIQEIMRDKRDKIETKLKGHELRFKDFYVELERYAGICTFSTAREIVNTSLHATESEISAKGRIKTIATEEAILASKEVRKEIKEENKKEMDTEKDRLKTENIILSNRASILMDEIKELKNSVEYFKNQADSYRDDVKETQERIKRIELEYRKNKIDPDANDESEK